MHGVGVSQGVWAGVLGQTSPLAGMCNGLADGFSAQRLAGILSGEQPFSRLHFSPISAQQFQQLGRELDVAVPMTLALLDPDHPALTVDMRSPQMQGLAD